MVRRRLALATWIAWTALNTGVAQAQGVEAPGLRTAFEAAWARQREAQALPARRDALRAQAAAAQAWTPEPPTLELSTKTDRLARNLGTHELEAAVAVPLWLPGERGRSQALAAAEGRALESETSAARLRVAATLREAWWAWQRAQVERDGARAQLDNVRRLTADVALRLRAGDVARADQHQADAAVAAADASLAQAEAALAATAIALRALTQQPLPASPAPGRDVLAGMEPMPNTEADAATPPHAELLALADRARVAEGGAALLAVQARANPELTLATTRDRGAYGEPYQQTITLGLRIPLGGGVRHEARLASARAEAAELYAQAELERARLASEQEAARGRADAARVQLAAAQRRAQLAQELRGFFDKSFRLGESDLPTRLRIEAEAAEAERQLRLARIERAAAISAWRQALGMLPQ